MNEVSLASIGDCCIDRYPDHDEMFPGGTAFNVAVQATLEGGVASLFSAIGTDANAQMVKENAKQYGIDLTYLEEKKGITSTIDITLTDNKEPVFSNWQLGVLQDYRLAEPAIEALGTFDVAKTVLFSPMKSLFEQFCSLQFAKTLKAVDFAGLSEYSDVLRSIDAYVASIDILIKSAETSGQEVQSYFQELSKKYPEKVFLVLNGKKGSTAFLNSQRFDQASIESNVQDTNGAGDAFVGTFLVDYVRTGDIQFSLFRGTLAASQIITHRGAVPIKK